MDQLSNPKELEGQKDLHTLFSCNDTQQIKVRVNFNAVTIRKDFLSFPRVKIAFAKFHFYVSKEKLHSITSSFALLSN